jgi:hypothetical protein
MIDHDAHLALAFCQPRVSNRFDRILNGPHGLPMTEIRLALAFLAPVAFDPGF